MTGMKILGSIAAIIIAFIVHPGLGMLTLALLFLYLIWAGRPRLYAYRGSVQYANGDVEGALKYYEKAYSLPGIKPNQRIGYGYLLLKLGDLDKAEKVITDVLKEKLNRDETIVAYSNYAILQWKKGDLDGAIQTLEETLANYKNTTLYISLGYFLIEKGDLERALAFNREAYEFNDSDPVVMDNYAYCLYLKGELNEAESIYEKAAEKNPRFPEFYYNYGLVLSALNKLDEAESQFKKSLEMKPSLINAVTKEKVDEQLRIIQEKRSELQS